MRRPNHDCELGIDCSYWRSRGTCKLHHTMSQGKILIEELYEKKLRLEHENEMMFSDIELVKKDKELLQINLKIAQHEHNEYHKDNKKLRKSKYLCPLYLNL